MVNPPGLSNSFTFTGAWPVSLNVRFCVALPPIPIVELSDPGVTDSCPACIVMFSGVAAPAVTVAIPVAVV